MSTPYPTGIVVFLPTCVILATENTYLRIKNPSKSTPTHWHTTCNPKICETANRVSSPLELSLGVQPIGKRIKSNTWKGALLVGSFVSLALIENWDDWDDRSGNKALFAILGGGVTGGALGGIFGALHKPERWTTLPLAHLKRYVPSVYRTP